MNNLSLTINWLWQQFQLKPGKPDYIYGARTLLVLGVPIAVGFFFGQPKAGAIATISALFVGMVNVSGAYRQQAKAILAATLGVTLALLIANLISSSFWLTIATTFIIIFLLGLASLYGSTAARVSLVVSMMFIISLARFSSFPNLVTVLEQCLFSLAGGLWTMALSLSLWIVRPYTPVIHSVADCYLATSKLALLARARVSNTQPEGWAKQFLQAQDVAIQNLTFARSIWTSVWTRGINNPRGSQLLVAIEDANQIINSLVSLVELIIIASKNPLFNHLQPQIEQAIERVAISLQRLSTALKKDRSSILLEDLERSIEALEHQWQSLRDRIHQHAIKIQANDYAELVNLRKIVTSLSELSAQIHTDAKITTDLSLSPTKPDKSFSTPEASFWLDTIKNNLNFGSVSFRHALRLAVVVTIAQLIAYFLPIPRGYWIALTALVALKPNFGGTFQATGQRVLGTFVGGIIGIVLVTIIHNSLAIAIAILLLMFAAMSLRSLSYSIFITLLTPVIILLLNAIGVGDWELGILRIVDSLIGGGLALLSGYLFFPSWERQQLAAQLEQTIRANLAYFQLAIAGYLNKEDDISKSSLHQLRHRAALENANAEAAAQRLFSEPRHVRGEIEPVMTLMLYIRSLFSSVTTLSEHLKEFSTEEPFTQIGQLTEAIEQVLDNLADALDRGNTLQPLPPLDDYLSVIGDRLKQLHTARISEITTYPITVTPTLQAVRQQTPVVTELERIVRAVTIMHCTIGRISK